MQNTPQPSQRRFGIGLRSAYAKHIAEHDIAVDWLEIHAENYFNPHSLDSYYLQRIAQSKPISMHGVGLSLGSSDKINQQHLQDLRELDKRIKPMLISEHLSWSSVNGHYYNDLLPIPYTKESLQRFIDNVDQTQQHLGRQILIENPSSYLGFAANQFTEPEFLNLLVEGCQCGLLLDLNNVYVSANNHGWDSKDYLAQLNLAAVGEIHLAGFTEKWIDGQRLLIDSHNQRVHQDVWQLYHHYQQHYANNHPVLLEWDSDFPELSVQLEEVAKAKAFAMESAHA